MKVEFTLEDERSERSETVEVGEDATVADALREADINPETVIAESSGQVIPLDEDCPEELRVFKVVSGG
ncbi:MAG: hypothetical protein ABEJ62_01565 [Candidatus Nanohaloarchaea archaeon]